MIYDIKGEMDRARLFVEQESRAIKSGQLEKTIKYLQENGPGDYQGAASAEDVIRERDNGAVEKYVDCAISKLESEFYALLESRTGSITPEHYIKWTERLFDTFSSGNESFKYDISVQVDCEEDPNPSLGVVWNQNSRRKLIKKLKPYTKLGEEHLKSIMKVSKDCPGHNHSFCFTETRTEFKGNIGASAYIIRASKDLIIAAYERMKSQDIDKEELTHDHTHQGLSRMLEKAFSIHHIHIALPQSGQRLDS